MVAREIAERVRTGALLPSVELPAVRAYAAQRGMTASTISRAYRYLADGGVITLADRRRARIAPEGAIAASRLLCAERVFRLAGSDDPALPIVLARAGLTIVPSDPQGSFHGLRALARHDADGAAIHLQHHNGTYNAPFARALLHNRNPHLLRLWRREQGLLVATGNPRGITGPADLAGLRVAKRQTGAGTRVLLDQLLIAADIAPDSVAGPELCSHREIALAVACGITDAGIGVRAAAHDFNLDFITVTWESYDIALPQDALGAAMPLITALRDPHVQTAINALGGYDLTDTGNIEVLTPTSPNRLPLNENSRQQEGCIAGALSRNTGSTRRDTN